MSSSLYAHRFLVHIITPRTILNSCFSHRLDRFINAIMTLLVWPHLCECARRALIHQFSLVTEAPPIQSHYWLLHTHSAWIDKIVCANFTYGISLNAHTHTYSRSNTVETFSTRLRANMFAANPQPNITPRALHSRVWVPLLIYHFRRRVLQTRECILSFVGLDTRFYSDKFLPNVLELWVGLFLMWARWTFGSLPPLPSSPSASHVLHLFSSRFIFLNLLLLCVHLFGLRAHLVWICISDSSRLPLLHNSIHYSSL